VVGLTLQVISFPKMTQSVNIIPCPIIVNCHAMKQNLIASNLQSLALRSTTAIFTQYLNLYPQESFPLCWNEKEKKVWRAHLTSQKDHNNPQHLKLKTMMCNTTLQSTTRIDVTFCPGISFSILF
jgi:hypothetical protein